MAETERMRGSSCCSDQTETLADAGQGGLSISETRLTIKVISCSYFKQLLGELLVDMYEKWHIAEVQTSVCG